MKERVKESEIGQTGTEREREKERERTDDLFTMYMVMPTGLLLPFIILDYSYHFIILDYSYQPDDLRRENIFSGYQEVVESEIGV